MKTRNMLVACLGAICGLAATIAMAAEWSRTTAIARLVVRDTQVVLVYREGGKWRNPDLCDSDEFTVLLPPGSNAAYKEVYATLLGAHLADRGIRVYLNGCTQIDNQTYPVLTRISVL